MYTRRTDEYDLRTMSSRAFDSRRSTPRLYSSAAYPGGPSIFGSEMRREIGPRAKKLVYPLKRKKPKQGGRCRDLSRMEWILLSATGCTLLAIIIVVIFLATADDAEYMKNQERLEEQKQLVLDGGKRMLSYMQPGANPCTDLYNHCCGNMLNDLFLESDVITRIENIPLKYNPERVAHIVKILRHYFELCEDTVNRMKDDSNVNNYKNDTIDEILGRILNEQRLKDKSLTSVLGSALTMGVDVLFKFTLSPDAADNPDGNLDRFFGPANSILIEPDDNSTTPENETIVQEILRKYFSTPWVAGYQDLRKNISNISQRIKSGLQNFTAQENDCNRILFGRNNAVSFDEFNTQGLFLMREAIFQYLRSSDPKLQYCLKDEVFEEISQIRPKNYSDLLQQLFIEYPYTTTWIHYITVQLLWNSWIYKSEAILLGYKDLFLQESDFSLFYSNILVTNAQTELARILTINYIKRLEIAPWSTKPTLVCDELHIPMGAVYPWLDKEISMFELISGRDSFHLYPLALLGEPGKYFSYFAELQEHFSEYKLAEWFHISYVQNFCQYRPISLNNNISAFETPHVEDIYRMSTIITKVFNCPQNDFPATTAKKCNKLFYSWLDD
ncbi:uncharacterized protein LOC142349960 isoform X2 [Convolutriloba macropyga]|uniref:uncharacterized protein LOC142349960 isoform X2 n=1 Tax=Convolutriloba macropyga TaxID=536237 RepID=UPI003F524E3F